MPTLCHLALGLSGSKPRRGFTRSPAAVSTAKLASDVTCAPRVSQSFGRSSILEHSSALFKTCSCFVILLQGFWYGLVVVLVYLSVELTSKGPCGTMLVSPGRLRGCASSKQRQQAVNRCTRRRSKRNRHTRGCKLRQHRPR